MIINVILIVIIIAVIFFAIRGTVKHFKGEGGCCGGGSSVVLIEPKPLEKVAATKTILIDGMKCEKCSARVQNALNSLDNVNAAVKLKKKTAYVKIGEGVTDEQLKAAIENDGYKVVSIN